MVMDITVCLTPNDRPYYPLICVSLSSQEGPISETVCVDCSCNTCSECKNCRYGEEEKIPTCEMALEHTTSNGGTIEELAINDGYWRATSDSTVILECYYAKACNGGVTGDPDYCKRGYKGACKLVG